MSVFSQSVSPCGKYLAAGNSYGEIGIFRYPNLPPARPAGTPPSSPNCPVPPQPVGGAERGGQRGEQEAGGVFHRWV